MPGFNLDAAGESRGHRLMKRLLLKARPRAPEALPIRFTRRRIYVLPTRFGLFYSALLATMLLGGLNYNNNPALLLALLMVGTGLSSLIAAQLQLSGMQVVAIDAEPVTAGQPLVLRLHAQAPTDRQRRGLQLGIELGSPSPAVLNLDEGRGEADLVLPTQRRGWLDIPRLRISTTRPLGLARAWAYAWPEQPLLVHATPEADGPPLPEGPGEAAQSRLKPIGEDVHHLRNYRAGDAQRAIAWKASARRDSLLVREYEQPLGTDIVLDWQATAGLPHEARVSRLARWVDLAEREGLRYRLALPAHPVLGPDQGPQHRHACQRALALMPHG